MQMKLMILAVLTMLMSSCGMRLTEEYKSTIVAKNMGSQPIFVRSEANKGLSLYDCTPNRVSKVREIPAGTAGAPGEVKIVTKISCRMPPVRKGRVELATDYVIATAEINNDMVFEPNSDGVMENRLLGKTLEVNSKSGRLNQLVEVVELVPAELKRDFYFVPVETDSIGKAFISSYGKSQNRAMIQIILGNNTLQVAADEELTVSIPDLGLFGRTSKPGTTKKSLQTTSRISHVLDFENNVSISVTCDDIGCNKNKTIPKAERNDAETEQD